MRWLDVTITRNFFLVGDRVSLEPRLASNSQSCFCPNAGSIGMYHHTQLFARNFDSSNIPQFDMVTQLGIALFINSMGISFFG
jgi:hypothetical protein